MTATLRSWVKGEAFLVIHSYLNRNWNHHCNDNHLKIQCHHFEWTTRGTIWIRPWRMIQRIWVSIGSFCEAYKKCQSNDKKQNHKHQHLGFPSSDICTILFRQSPNTFPQKQEKPDLRAFLQPWTFLKTIEIVSFVVSYVTGCHIFFHLGKSINTWTLNSIWLPYCLNYHQLQCRSSSINFSHHGPNFDTILTQINVNISLFYAANNSHKKRPISHWFAYKSLINIW